VDAQVAALRDLNARGLNGRVILARSFLTTKEFENRKGPRLTAFMLYALLLLRGPSPSEMDFQANAVAAASGNLLLIVNACLGTAEHRSVIAMPDKLRLNGTTGNILSKVGLAGNLLPWQRFKSSTSCCHINGPQLGRRPKKLPSHWH
jgi:hypothetical protein